jgi:dihydroflavonol-4-reductase
MHTFVTGATGLLGNAIVRDLLAADHTVTVLARSPEKAARLLGDLDVTVVEGDLRDVAAFEHALDGVDALVHAAAYFREYYTPGDHWDRLRAINVDATVMLLEAAARHGVARAVHVSSSGVIGPGPGGAPGDETTVIDPGATDNLYFRSKVLAERAIDEFVTTHDMAVMRVLPGWMHGPRDAAPTAGGQLVLDLARGDLPGLFEGAAHVVDARDVATAIRVALERGDPGERYVVAGQYVTLDEFADTVASLAGVAPPRRIPYPVAAVLARLGDVYGRLTGRPVPLTTTALDSLRQSFRIDSGKAERELGATFRPLEETFRDELAWFAANGYLDGPMPVDRSVPGPQTTPGVRD